jgi:hypothetical protein
MKQQPKEKHGIVPDLLIGTDLFELKNICYRTPPTRYYSGALRCYQRYVYTPEAARCFCLGLGLG